MLKWIFRQVKYLLIYCLIFLSLCNKATINKSYDNKSISCKQEVVQQIIKYNLTRLIEYYNEKLLNDSTLKGNLYIKLNLNENGNYKNIEIIYSNLIQKAFINDFITLFQQLRLRDSLNICNTKSINLQIVFDAKNKEIMLSEIKGGSLKGLLPPNEVMKVINENTDKIKYLYNQKLKETPDLKGIISVKFAIDEFGKVIYVQVVESSIADNIFESKLIEVLRGLKFPKVYFPGGMTEVVYPFIFTK